VKVGFIFGLALLLDQLTKIVIRQTMMLHQSISVLGEFVKITYVKNPGIAFGLRVPNNTIFTILSILASIGIAVYLFTHLKEGMAVKASLALILGGAVGNLIDRLLFGEVVDFIDVGLKTLRWPVFNVADSVVVIGMFILLFTVFRTNGTEELSNVSES
jgi:signal peptidase II